MDDPRNLKQIIRKDARNCFVESLSDCFDIGKAHFTFAAYDVNQPAGQRQTNNIHIYVDIPLLLSVCTKLVSGELREVVKRKKVNRDATPVLEWLGGTSAEKLEKRGKAREDGMCVARTAKLICGSLTDFLFIADSGPGVQNEKGLIVPQFGRNPENHVVVSLSWDDMSELFLMTKVHYQAWLTAWYGKQMR